MSTATTFPTATSPIAARTASAARSQNLNFGNPAITTRYADDVLRGFGVRPYNWDMSAEVQHQVGAAMSVTAGYYRNWYGNFRVTDNQAVTPADYKTYCVTGPADSRLPGGGEYRRSAALPTSIPTKFGQVNNLVRRAKEFGDQKQVSNFYLFSVDARLPSGARFGGGIDTGTTRHRQLLRRRLAAAAA